MKSQGDNIPRIIQLAQRIERDIQERNLRAGDAYLTTAQTARMLGASTTIANRALQFLARNGRLERKQRRGTFVADPNPGKAGPAISRVHLVVHQRYMKAEGLLADGVIVGLQTELPGVDVSFNFMPPGAEREYVEDLTRSIMQSGQPEGLVLVRAPLEVQQLVDESGLAAVVYGTPYLSVNHLSFVDADQRAIGQLLTEHALAKGASQILVVMRDRMLPGDSPYLDAVHGAVARAGLAADRIRIRFLARDRELVAAEVRDLLGSCRNKASEIPVSNSPQSPPLPAILCRDEPLADLVLGEVEGQRLTPGKDLVVAVSTIYRRGNEDPPPIPFTQYAESPIQIGEHLGRLLVSRADRKPSRSRESKILPVTLCLGRER